MLRASFAKASGESLVRVTAAGVDSALQSILATELDHQMLEVTKNCS